MVAVNKNLHFVPRDVLQARFTSVVALQKRHLGLLGVVVLEGAVQLDVFAVLQYNLVYTAACGVLDGAAYG